MKQETETPKPAGRKIKWIEKGLLLLGMPELLFHWHF
jgi:hypothetical protein